MNRPEARECFSWSGLQEVIKSNELERLGRSNQCQDEYMEYMTKLTEDGWKTPSDYLLHHVFEYEFTTNKEDIVDGMVTPVNLILPHPSLPQPLGSGCPTILKLKKNDYPYRFEPGIAHFCLWKLNGTITEEDLAFGENELRELMMTANNESSDVGDVSVVDICRFNNPPALKSIKDIDHTHFMARWGITTL